MTSGNSVPYWPGYYGMLTLQATTNLSPPVAWTDLPNAVTESGTTTVTNAYPQQFFRVAPLLPIYQFAIFYNLNLEIMSAAAFNVYGPVFCNQNIWEGSTYCTFFSAVTAAGTNAVQAANPFSADYMGSGPASFVMAGQPTSHAPPLALAGFGTNSDPATMRSLLDLPPAAYALGSAAAYSANGSAYLANSCDLVITNFASGTNAGSALPVGTNYIVYLQDNSLTPLPYDFYKLKTGGATNYLPSTQTTNIAYAGFSWITNVTFYDWREGWNNGSGPAKKVQALQINLTTFSLWITNTARNGGSDPLGVNPDPTKLLHTGHHLDSIYVYTGVPLTTSQLPAIRLVNGAQLPNPGNSTSPAGLSVATPFPMYVLGNYNTQTFNGSALGKYCTNGATTYTVPAALMADAVTILSPSWIDYTSSSKTIGGPSASSTTVNAAVLEGIVQSNPTASGDLGMNGDYSGGVENSLRMLENWSSQTLTYNGSIVVLFSSQYATNCWRQTGEYYTAPTRHWAFDLNFQNYGKLPPLTPAVKNYVSRE